MGFDSIPGKDTEALDGSLLPQALLRNGGCHTAEDLGKRGKSQEQETQDYQLHLSSCYSKQGTIKNSAKINSAT